MLESRQIVEHLSQEGVEFFTGVPDTILAPFVNLIARTSSQHMVAVNEGAAVGLAIGYHLASGRIPLVYLQNSGLGHAMNPLTSLADSQVYQVPMILLIGWRGEPDRPDEPQHLRDGEILRALLALLGIQWSVLPKEILSAKKLFTEACQYAKEHRSPCAILVQAETFALSEAPSQLEGLGPTLTRQEALRAVLPYLDPKDVVVCTTGGLSREWYEYRRQNQQSAVTDFLCVGGMGHAAAVALGIALSQPERRVYCLDGDGALLMHLGTMATIGVRKPWNLRHLLFNNGCHDSVGGLPTGASALDLPGLAKSVGYRIFKSVKTREDLARELEGAGSQVGPIFLEIGIRPGSEKRPRPASPLKDLKQKLIESLTGKG